jgi:hypothetical protein
MKNTEVSYEVWALGYDAEGEATDVTIFLGEFDNPEDAIEHAKKFYDVECITGKEDHPDYNPIVDFYPEEGDYLEVHVETVVECEDPEDGTENIDTIWEAQLKI